MSIYELQTEPDNIENEPKIPETFSIHKVTRSFNEDNICFIDFFRVANDDDTFFYPVLPERRRPRGLRSRNFTFTV